MSSIYSPSQVPKRLPNSKHIQEYYRDLKPLTPQNEKGENYQDFLKFANLPDSLKSISTESFFETYGEKGVEMVHGWYCAAMTRRNNADGEPRAALEYDRFYNHFFNNESTQESLMYGNIDDGYLLGSTFDNFFHVSHFAPKTLKGGYRLLKNLGEDTKVPTILTITEYLIQTIKKMEGWNYSEMSLPGFGMHGESKYLAWNNDSMVHERLDSIVDYCISNGFDLPSVMVKSFLEIVFSDANK
jgi:hypothetical protein